MSTSGSLNTRLILAAALGVASLTVFMFVLRRKTRRLLKSEDNPETMESDQLEESTQIDQNVSIKQLRCPVVVDMVVFC